ncbi:unnamed protein product [Mycena citricolor]|uniref:Thioesterase domain-containing protein n=1 Tax=Mycena citricolor TaxID=2018698 RepID=A0AAD2K730_9AGAR|nr:unnamed protein product [Mycena citricolor]
MSSHGPVPSSSSKVWIDPALLPSDLETDIASVAGNAPDGVKQLVVNTFYAYGVGTSPDTFGYRVGRATRWVDMSVSAAEPQASVKKGKQRMEAVTVAEVTVSKDMLNGAGMLHGGCLTYLIDNCASTPLIVLGLLSGMNGVGVTQSMNVLFHAPAPLCASIYNF